MPLFPCPESSSSPSSSFPLPIPLLLRVFHLRLRPFLVLLLLLLPFHYSELSSPSMGPNGTVPTLASFSSSTQTTRLHNQNGLRRRRKPDKMMRERRDRKARFFGDSAELVNNDEGQSEKRAPASFSRVRTREQQEQDLEDDLRAEFVRVSTKNDPDASYRFRKKTYTTMPRPFECYSCMSSSYQPKWNFLQQMYLSPKAFTDACDEPIHRRTPIPTILCGSFCVTMLEASVEAGIFVGFKYIRGCGDRLLRHGFNQSALRIHRFSESDKCRHLPRERLFNQPRQLGLSISGDLQLCTCYGERCNNNSPNSAPQSWRCPIWPYHIHFLSCFLCSLLLSQEFYEFVHFILNFLYL